MEMRSFQILKQQIRNQRGDVMVIALSLTVISMLSSMFMMNYIRQVEAQSKIPRIKSMMTATEAKVRELLLAPTSYIGCLSGDSGPTGRASCRLDNAKVDGLSRMLPYAPCPTNAPCGIRVSVVSFDPMLTLPSGALVSRAIARVRYEGTDMSLHDIDITMDIPADILQDSGIFQCPDTAPKFLGFKSNGQINCVGITGTAGMGQFVDSIDMTSLVTTAFNLPALVSCPTDQYVNYVNWGLGGTAFSSTCTPRPDPFVVFGFTPGAVASDVTTVVNTD